MVIDTSAIIAVLLNEAGAAHIAQAIEASSRRLLSAASLLEASIVIESRKGEAGGRELDLLLYRAAIEIVAVDPDRAETTPIAWRRFRRGRHPAGLNYGDCFCLCSGEDPPPAVAVSGRRLLSNRHRRCSAVAGANATGNRDELNEFFDRRGRSTWRRPMPAAGRSFPPPSGIRSPNFDPRRSRFRLVPGRKRPQTEQPGPAIQCRGSRSPASSSAARGRRAPRSSHRPAAASTRGVSFDHLVGAGEDRWRDRQAERLRRLQVGDEVEFYRLLDG
jgi:ribonuclease VapC